MITKRWELRHCADPLETRLYKGGGGTSSSATLQTTTINSDSRAVLQDAVQVGANAQSTVNFNTSQADAEVMRTLAENIPDAMVALGQAGATIIKDAGGSVIDLNKDSVAANSKAWDATLQAGVSIVDKAIESMQAGYGLADKAIEKFQPTDNANADIGKYAMLAAAAVAAAVLLSKDKK
ncbi:hypothetical protein [Variovorax sp. 3P27G3]|uniref:hypothetical protein n=1 Tax=Variovorax sp. 3P27G3 TaxID=2502214 RepID=UPI0010F6F82A|nr:hypothetical protein [Variovorax sp. 3P27G3]